MRGLRSTTSAKAPSSGAGIYREGRGGFLYVVRLLKRLERREDRTGEDLHSLAGVGEGFLCGYKRPFTVWTRSLTRHGAGWWWAARVVLKSADISRPSRPDLTHSTATHQPARAHAHGEQPFYLSLFCVCMCICSHLACHSGDSLFLAFYCAHAVILLVILVTLYRVIPHWHHNGTIVTPHRHHTNTTVTA